MAPVSGPVDYNEEEKKYSGKSSNNRRVVWNPDSDKSKSSSKAKHKHIYEECLVKTPDDKYYRASRCKLCGKINTIRVFAAVRDKTTGARRLLAQTEIREIYSDLPVYNIKDFWDKFTIER